MRVQASPALPAVQASGLVLDPCREWYYISSIEEFKLFDLGGEKARVDQLEAEHTDLFSVTIALSR